MFHAPRRSTSPSISGDDDNYSAGSIAHHDVVIARLLKESTGTVSAAILLSPMRRTFPNLKYGVMVGIGAGVPGRSL